MTSPSNINIQLATLSQLPSLSTIVPRSFFPNNSFCAQCFPDTPTVRAWWTKILTDEITHPDCHVIIATRTENTTDSDEGKDVLGLLCLRLMNPEDKGCGFWSEYEYTPDHDLVAFQPVIDAATRGRTSMMAGEKHFLIELFAVDAKVQGQGIGKALIAKTCEIIDAEGVDAFVESERDARFVYAKGGFGVEEKVTYEGSEMEQYLMVRRSSKQRNETES